MKNPITSFLNQLRAFALTDPTRDWIALLTLATIAIIGIVTWNAWVFDTVASGGTLGAAASSTPPSFTQASLDSVRTVFEARAAEEAKYVSGTYKFNDPSQ